MIRGEAGIGKSVLVEYCAQRAVDCRVVRISAVESELEMPFAAVHQLCAPLLSGVGKLPEPQENALRIAFGMASGNPPDRLFVGLAILSLFADTAANRPLLCLVDDAQWLDPASRPVLAFVGRRLLAEAVALVFAVREEPDARLLPALPEMTLQGLADSDAISLLEDAVTGQLDERVRDRIVATRGNPLGLLELSRMSPAELAGGFALPTGTCRVTSRTASSPESPRCRRRRSCSCCWRRLIHGRCRAPVARGAVVRYRARRGQPLRVRIRCSRSDRECGSGIHSCDRQRIRPGRSRIRRAADRAIARATDQRADPAHRVWHLAAAAEGPDEAIAVELERTARLAQPRADCRCGSVSQRSVTLTGESARLADRGRRRGKRTRTRARSMLPTACWSRPRWLPSTISTAPR